MCITTAKKHSIIRYEYDLYVLCEYVEIIYYIMANIIKEKDFIQQNIVSKTQDYELFITHAIAQHPYIDQDTIISFAKAIYAYDHNAQLQYPVLALRMGLGKTSLLHAYIQHKLQQYPRYGAIVAVERVETIQELCKKYPIYYGLYGFRKDDCLAHNAAFNPNICRVCHYNECRVHQNETRCSEAQILVMTHMRLHLLMKDMSFLSKYLFYKKGTEQYKREDLFIDESPGFYTPCHIGVSDIKTFQQALHTTYQRDCKSRRELITYFNAPIESLKDSLSLSDKHIHTPSIRLSVFDQYKEKFLINYYGSQYSTAMNVFSALSSIGIVDNHMKLVPLMNDVGNLLFKTIVFDGTATIDRTYPDTALIVDFEERRVFPNTILTVDRTHNLSKEYYDTHNEIIPVLVDKIREQMLQHPHILVITFKEHEDIYRSYFTQTELEQHVYFNHFNNTKGRNDYRECTCVFILGTLYKGDSYYLGKYTGDHLDIEFINKSNQRLAYHISSKLTCDDINTFIATDQATTTAQELYRCKIRTDAAAHTNLFLWSTNPNYIQYVISMFPEVRVNYIDYEHDNPVQKQLITILDTTFETENVVRKDTIRKLCNISRDSLKTLLKTSAIQAYLNNKQIAIKKFQLSKMP